MKKITKIVLDNFQSHRHTELDIDEAITLITGSSDSGKSSLVRALRWVFFNRPPKGNFMFDRKGTTRVALQYDTGDTLIREKGPGTNQYQLNDKVFKAIKSDVPSEISNFHQVTLDNCQWQHPHYFLLDETPGNVAKRLNEIADLSIMDVSLKTVNSMVRETDAEVAQLNSVLVGLQDHLSKLDWVAAAKILADQGNVLQDAYDKLFVGRNAVRGAMSNIERITDRLDQFPDLSGLSTIDGALEQQAHRNNLQKQVKLVVSTLANIMELRQTADAIPDIDLDEIATALDTIEEQTKTDIIRQQLATSLQKIDTLQTRLKSMVDIDEGIDTVAFEDQRRSLTVSKSQLRSIITSVEQWQGKLKAAEIAVLDAEEAYDKLTDEIGICPVCGNDFKQVDSL